MFRWQRGWSQSRERLESVRVKFLTVLKIEQILVKMRETTSEGEGAVLR